MVPTGQSNTGSRNIPIYSTGTFKMVINETRVNNSCPRIVSYFFLYTSFKLVLKNGQCRNSISKLL